MMQFPNERESIATLLALGHYATARVRAKEETCALAPTLLEPQQRLQEAVAVHEAALVEEIHAAAMVAARVDDLNDLVMDLGRQALALFARRESPGFRRLFPVAPSAIVTTPARRRAQVYGKLVLVATDRETPAELRPIVEKLAAAWQAVEAAEGEARLAESRVEGARRQLDVARAEWSAGYRRLAARLVEVYPHGKAQVERFFRKVRAAQRREPPAPVVHDLRLVSSEDQAALGDEPSE